MDTFRARLTSIAQSLGSQRNKFSSVKSKLDAINSRNATLTSCCIVLDDGNYEIRRLGESIEEISLQLGIYDKNGKQEERRLQERGDGYKIQLQRAENEILDLRTARDKYKADLDEAELTIRDLRAALRQERIKYDKLVHGHAGASSEKLHPTGAGSRPASSGSRSSIETNDSGISGLSSTPDQSKQRVAFGLLHSGQQAFERNEFREAKTYLESLQKQIDELPGRLRQAFNLSSIAYYRAVCTAETASNQAAKEALYNFLQHHDNPALVTESQVAHIEHLLARTYVKLDRLQDALDHCHAAAGSRFQIASSDASERRNYIDSLSLMVRIYQLQGKTTRANSVIEHCTAEWGPFLRNKYANLRPEVTVPIVPPTPVPPIVLPQAPSKATPRVAPSTASSTTSRATSSSGVTKRRQDRVKQLPWLFRLSLT